MKSLSTLISFSFLLIIISCNKTSDQNLIEPNAGLSGKWALIQIYTDPGDGSGTFHSVDSAGYYIQFNSDSSFNDNFNSNLIPPFFNPITIKYSVLNDSMINLIDSAMNIFHRYYNIKGDTLTITGGCYEGCGSKFIKE